MAKRFRLDRRGSMVAEFALVVPILLTLTFGIIQAGVLFLANAGLKHSLGEGARLATLFPRRTDAQIIQRIEAAQFGLNPAYLATPTISHGVSQGSDYTDISVSYTVHLDLLVTALPAVTLTERRRAYSP